MSAKKSRKDLEAELAEFSKQTHGIYQKLRQIEQEERITQVYVFPPLCPLPRIVTTSQRLPRRGYTVWS